MEGTGDTEKFQVCRILTSKNTETSTTIRELLTSKDILILQPLSKAYIQVNNKKCVLYILLPPI